MGLNENEKVIVQISEKKKREYLIGIVQKYLETGKSLMEYLKAVAPTRKAKYSCNKSIKKIEEGITHLRQIKHIEVLEYLYSTFIGNGVIAYSISGGIVCSPKMKEYDTESGVKELIELMKETQEKQKAKFEEKQRQKEAIEKAKEQGKNVEMVWDKDTKTVKPMIVEEKPNA